MTVRDGRRIAIIGGTGALGGGLALRLARAGHGVIIGSRDLERGSAKALELADKSGGSVEARSYAAAASNAEITILAIPYPEHAGVVTSLKPSLAGKILVDATVPLVPPKVARVQLPADGSAAVIAQSILGGDTTVVSAFQNVGAHHLLGDARSIECDVLVSGDDPEARARVIELIESCGMRGLHAGPLANAAAAEALTSVLIFLNRHYKSDRAGIRITGI